MTPKKIAEIKFILIVIGIVLSFGYALSFEGCRIILFPNVTRARAQHELANQLKRQNDLLQQQLEQEKGKVKP